MWKSLKFSFQSPSSKLESMNGLRVSKPIKVACFSFSHNKQETDCFSSIFSYLLTGRSVPEHPHPSGTFCGLYIRSFYLRNTGIDNQINFHWWRPPYSWGYSLNDPKIPFWIHCDRPLNVIEGSWRKWSLWSCPERGRPRGRRAQSQSQTTTVLSRANVMCK